MCVFGPLRVRHAFNREGNEVHRVLKLAVVVFVGAVTGASATYQPMKSAEQTDPISYTTTWPHLSMLYIAPRAAATPSNSGLRMAQSDCSACNMLYQQGAGQCQAFGYSNDQYRYCMAMVQQNAQQCMRACASGAYPGTGMNVPLCQQFPNNPACR
jgi:hypothetical protein